MESLLFGRDRIQSD